MMKSMSLLKPSLNPNYLMQCSNYCVAHGSLRNNLSLFLVAKPGRVSRPNFRLIPHAQASASSRSVWDDAAEEFFSAKGQEASTREKDREKPYGRASNYSDARFGRRERDGEEDRDARNNAGFGRTLNSSGSQAKKAVSFVSRERGDRYGEERRAGEGGRTNSTWSNSSRSSNSGARSSKQTWGNNRTGGPNGYRSDRGGGYGGESRRREHEGYEDATDSEDWPNREAVNWRLEGEALYGVAPIRAALLGERRQFFTLYVQANLVENVATGKRKDKQAVNWILNRAHNLEMKVETVSKQHLNLLVDNRPHQGLVLDATPLEMVPCEYLDRPVNQDGRCPVWVALDEVMDPQNFGAILRSCHYLGATGVIVCAKNSAPLSGVVSKASSGALEVMEIQSCRNMMKFLETSVLNGWRAVGASSEPRALPIQDLEPGLPTILVLGNEGRGLRTNVKRSCTELISIKGFGVAGISVPVQESDPDVSEARAFGSELQAAAEAVDSLNVSVAAGILLHDLLSRSVQQKEPAVVLAE